MQPVYYLVCRQVQLPGVWVQIGHVQKVFETTLDKIDALYRQEVAPLQSVGINVYPLILERPANLDFLKQLEKAENQGGKK